MPLDQEFRKAFDIFFCHGRKRLEELKERRTLLAHYTTAETAIKILKSRSLWLRNAAVMNDFSEIEHGKAQMQTALSGQIGDRYRGALNAIHDGIAKRVMELHDEHRSHAREAIFTASLSEHDPSDMLGRLSMWRAYGGPVAGVALLFHGWVADIEIEPSIEVGVSPILYGGQDKFEAEFLNAIEKIEENILFLRTFDPAIICNIAAQVLQIAMFSIKHCGFSDEQEWRVIHRPHQFPSPKVTAFNDAVNGIPQTIYEMPFHSPNRGPEFEIPELDLDTILAGVLLGPCAYPETIFRALREEMETAGIKNPENRIFVSEIPLRQQW